MTAGIRTNAVLVGPVPGADALGMTIADAPGTGHDVRWGVSLPLAGLPLRRHRPVLERLSDLGYQDVWTAEGRGADGFVPLASAAAWAPELRPGTAIVPAATRGAAVLAQSAVTLGQLCDEPMVLGIGSSVPDHVSDISGIPFDRPFARVRDTLRFLVRAFSGETVKGDFETFSVSGFELPVMPDRAPRVILGALRPRMTNLAFAEGDGAVFNLLGARDLDTVLDSVTAPVAGKEVVVKLFVSPTADARSARAQGRAFLAWILTRPPYSAFHRWLGRHQVMDELNRRWAAGDRAGAAASIPDDLVDALWLHGDPATLRERIRAFVRPPVTTVNLFVAPDPTRRTTPQMVWDTLADLAPSAGVTAGRPGTW
jgi:probable F420-dependent oxidoreductase